MSSTAAAARRLVAAAQAGEIAPLCAKHRIDLLVLFGSAADDATLDPGDIDVAVRFEHGTAGDVLEVLNDLSELVDTDDLDVMILNCAGPLARERALVSGLPLYEASRGSFATAQMAAILDRMDTAHLRRMDLESMAR